MPTSALVAVAALIAPGPAFAQDMCAALDRIVAASREPVAFASLKSGAEVVPGYDDCRVVDGAAADGAIILCSAGQAPPALEAGHVAAQVAACLELALEPAPHRRTGPIVLRRHGLRFVVDSSCDARCKAGRTASFIVERDAGGDPPA